MTNKDKYDKILGRDFVFHQEVKMKLSRDASLLLRKILIYFVIIFISALLQTSFLAVIEPFGALPDLMLLMSLGAGYFCGPIVGGIFGVASGAAAYALGDAGIAFLPLLYCAVGAFVGFLVENFFSGKFAVWLLYVFAAAAVKGGYSLACIILFSGDAQFFAAIWHSVIPEFVGTLLLGAAMYLPIKKICKYL